MSQEDYTALDEALKSSGEKEVFIDEIGDSVVLKADIVKLETKKEKQTTNTFTPGVIEPSFGIDRIFASILEHAYYARSKEDNSEDKQVRGVLALAPGIAPFRGATSTWLY